MKRTRLKYSCISDTSS